MNASIKFIFIIMLNTCPIFGMFQYPVGTARNKTTGNACFGKASGIDALYSNPADLICNKQIVIGANFSQPYNLDGLTCFDSGAIFPLTNNALGLSIAFFGTSFYKETTFKIGYAHLFFKKIAVGSFLKLHNLYIEEYKNAHTFALDIGVTLAITDRFTAGYYLQNCNKPYLAHDTINPICSIQTVGLSWQITQKALLLFNLSCREREPISAITTLEYKLFSYGQIRAGHSSYPAEFKLGFGIQIYQYGIDYNFTYPISGIGVTHLFSVNYAFTAKHKQRFLPPVQLDSITICKKMGPININKASIEKLIILPGISRSLARRIIRSRKLKGPFTHIQELCRIRGINHIKLIKIMKYISVTACTKQFLPLKDEKNNLLGINNMEMYDLIKLGISPIAARNIIIYRNSRGGIAALKETLKIPGLTLKEKQQLLKALRCQK